MNIQSKSILSGNGSSADPQTNLITLVMDNSFVWPFGSDSVDHLQGNIITASMDRNMARHLGFVLSTLSGTKVIVENIRIGLDSTTMVTASPHRMESNAYFQFVSKTGTVNACRVTSIINEFTFTAAIGSTTGSIPGQYLQISPDQIYIVQQTASGAKSTCIGSSKIDLTVGKRHVLVRCVLNGSYEIGNIFLPQSNMRFLARVQLKSISNSIQFSTDSDHIEGSYIMPKPMNRVDSIRLELYSDSTQKLYDLQGLEWSLLADFVCDNEGK